MRPNTTQEAGSLKIGHPRCGVSRPVLENTMLHRWHNCCKGTPTTSKACLGPCAQRPVRTQIDHGCHSCTAVPATVGFPASQPRDAYPGQYILPRFDAICHPGRSDAWSRDVLTWGGSSLPLRAATTHPSRISGYLGIDCGMVLMRRNPGEVLQNERVRG